jgi:hypothetical protein
MFQEIIVSLTTIFGFTGLFIYLCEKYTIKKVKDLEIELSKVDDLTDEERRLIESIREFLICDKVYLPSVKTD